MLDFVEWIAASPRRYSDVMEAWKTSCPRLTIWEDAIDQGLVQRCRIDGELSIETTEAGRDLLAKTRRSFSASRAGTMRQTLYDKIWRDHLVEEAPDGTCLLYVDRHLVHEVDSPQAFASLRRCRSAGKGARQDAAGGRPQRADVGPQPSPTRIPRARRRSPISPRTPRCSASNITTNSTGGRASATSSAPSRALRCRAR